MRKNESFRVKKEDYYTLYSEFCSGHNFASIHIDAIEEMFINYNSGYISYICCFWNTGSTICVLGFPVSNPHLSSKFKRGGLDHIIKIICEYAKNKDYRLVWTTSGTERVINSLSENDFIKGDKNVNQYIKLL